MRRCCALLALPTAAEYMKMPLDDLAKLLDLRVEQIQTMRDIHERTHLSAEHAYRKQMLDYDERTLLLGEHTGQATQSQIAWHREDLKHIRETDYNKARDQTLVAIAAIVTCCSYWWYLVRHYPMRPTIAEKHPTMGSPRVMGNPFGYGWMSRHVDTDFERELKKRQKEAAAPGAEPTTPAKPAAKEGTAESTS